jgi:hypothetical protein
LGAAIMRRKSWPSSVRLEAGCADNFAPFVGFGRDELAEVGRRASERLTAKLGERRF